MDIYFLVPYMTVKRCCCNGPVDIMFVALQGGEAKGARGRGTQTVAAGKAGEEN
jgi:hypothetical protein